jgi:hypothetical protein
MSSTVRELASNSLWSSMSQIECHFKIFVVKRARGDLSTDGNNFTLLPNMMDYVNYRRFKVIKTKVGYDPENGKLRNRRRDLPPRTRRRTSRPYYRQHPLLTDDHRKIVRMRVFGTTFGRNGNTIYGTGLNSPHTKFFEYTP